jgi:hypothetical protein
MAMHNDMSMLLSNAVAAAQILRQCRQQYYSGIVNMLSNSDFLFLQARQLSRSAMQAGHCVHNTLLSSTNLQQAEADDRCDCFILGIVLSCPGHDKHTSCLCKPLLYVLGGHACAVLADAL